MLKEGPDVDTPDIMFLCSGVSYIPEKVLAHPGENISLYCVFNDHSINANSAVWMRNLEQPLSSSQYHSVNQRVSHITIQPSDSGMYELLQCRATKEWPIPYSIIYVEVERSRHLLMLRPM
ncbi:leptin receptor-like isoform X2 [Hippocampus comes]|uniref:leptin receptor-like isoform X2 n=1 Tax=Hippocampus comes TaxID=109280 RepID=UPI00094EA4EF|nr:PREDICTED: leptin receptor-like isoform X2 [Hippocampus comes]